MSKVVVADKRVRSQRIQAAQRRLDRSTRIQVGSDLDLLDLARRRRARVRKAAGVVEHYNRQVDEIRRGVRPGSDVGFFQDGGHLSFSPSRPRKARLGPKRDRS